MDLQLLHTFVVVSEELHFGRAAKRLHLAPQAVSQQVKRLEADLRVQLFHRTTRRVGLTPAGADLVPDAQRLLAQADDLRRRATAAARGEGGRCRLGYDPTTVTNLVPHVVRQCRHGAPGVELVLEEVCPPDLERRVHAGSVDVGLAGPAADLDGLEAIVLVVDRPVLAVPADHVLAGRTRVTIDELADHPLVAYDAAAKPGAHGLVTALFTQGGVVPTIEITASSELAVLGMVVAGKGVGIVTGHTAATTRLPFVTIDLDATLELPSHLLWTGDHRDGPVRRVIETIRAGAFFRGSSGGSSVDLQQGSGPFPAVSRPRPGESP